VLQQELRDPHAPVARRRPERRGTERIARVDVDVIGGQEALDHVRVAHAWPVSHVKRQGFSMGKMKR